MEIVQCLTGSTGSHAQKLQQLVYVFIRVYKSKLENKVEINIVNVF